MGTRRWIVCHVREALAAVFKDPGDFLEEPLLTHAHKENTIQVADEPAALAGLSKPEAGNGNNNP